MVRAAKRESEWETVTIAEMIRVIRESDMPNVEIARLSKENGCRRRDLLEMLELNGIGVKHTPDYKEWWTYKL